MKIYQLISELNAIMDKEGMNVEVQIFDSKSDSYMDIDTISFTGSKIELKYEVFVGQKTEFEDGLKWFKDKYLGYL
jgi:hypothetical protein